MKDKTSAHLTFGRGDAAIITTCMLWGLGTVVIKNVLGNTPETLNIFVFNGIRLPIGTLLLFSTEKMLGNSIGIRRKDFILLALVSLLGFFNTILFLYGLELTTASNAGVITATVPLFILLVSFFSGIERPTAFTILGIFVGSCGALVLCWHRGALTFNTGDAIVLCACSLWGAFTVYSKKIVSIYTPMVTAGWIFLFIFFYQFPFFILKLPEQSWATLPLRTWINFWISVIGPLFLANSLYYYSVKTIGPSRVGVYIYLIPFFTLAFAFLIRNETITLQQIIGLTVIIIGISLTKKKVYRRPMY